MGTVDQYEAARIELEEKYYESRDVCESLGEKLHGYQGEKSEKVAWLEGIVSRQVPLLTSHHDIASHHDIVDIV